MSKLLPFLLLLAICLCGSSATADDVHADHEITLGTLGMVNFDVGCSAAARRDFPHAVALLHSFAYERALAEFTAVAKEDPKCAMAYWGQAMTYWRPLWFPPDQAALRQGAAAIHKAADLDLSTGREKGFVAALLAFYTDYDKVDYATRAMTYRTMMARLHKYLPKDNEVAVFYALSLLATASPTDKSYRDQREAVALLEKVFSEEPNHPGAAHYLIYSCDNAVLAKHGLLAARSYARVAPAVAHALHMPSHIFTRLGLWQDSITSNVAAEQAAKQVALDRHMSFVSDEQLHAMDYLMYAYLQQGRERDASKVLNELKTFTAVQPSEAAFYAVAAIPARYTVERNLWADAVALQPYRSGTPETQAITYWARALGAAHLGNLDLARAELEQLESLRDTLAKASPAYDWAGQVEIQRREVAAWLSHAQHDDDAALSMMRSAVDLEDSSDKSGITPGPVLPARDLLADLLMAMHRPQDAFSEYETSLKSAPHRFHAVHGAALAAEAAEDHQAALRYWHELLELTAAGRQLAGERQSQVFLAAR